MMMLVINKEKGEVVYAYESTKGLVQGRIVYFKNMLDELTFTLNGRTVSHFGDIRDIGMMLSALGNDLVVESKESETDGSLTADAALKTDTEDGV
jgi:hypothetical protein